MVVDILYVFLDDATLDGVLKCFSNSTSTKSIIKNISIGVAQLLLAHAFHVIILVLLFHAVNTKLLSLYI